MRQTLKSLKKSDGGPESEELVRKERKAETKKLKKQKKARAKEASKECTKGQALYLLTKACQLGDSPTASALRLLVYWTSRRE